MSKCVNIIKYSFCSINILQDIVTFTRIVPIANLFLTTFIHRDIFFPDICCLSVQGQGQGGGKNIIGGPIVAEEVNIIDGALKFR